jgi:hypothetical protein
MEKEFRCKITFVVFHSIQIGKFLQTEFIVSIASLLHWHHNKGPRYPARDQKLNELVTHKLPIIIIIRQGKKQNHLHIL